MTSKIKVGIIGYGFAAKSFHLPFIRAIPEYEVIAILQRAAPPEDPASAPKGLHCTADIPGIKHYRRAEEFFLDSGVDLVVVATHLDTHASYAEAALTAGMHVLVDKPFARSTEEADRIIQLAREKGLLATCFQNRRYDGDFKTVRALLEKKALGNLTEAEIHYDFDRAPWLHHMTELEYTPGSGMAFGLGTHSIDQAYALFGRPSSITAFYCVHRGPVKSDVEDSFTIILRYDESTSYPRLLVTVKTSIVSPMAQQLKFWIRGTAGSYIKFQQRSTCPQEEHITQGLHPLDPKFGVENESLCGTLTSYEAFDAKLQSYDEKAERWVGKYPSVRGRWMGVYEDLGKAIRGEAELTVRAEEVRDVLRIIELARESSEKGMTVHWR
ncbi:hypothetical protein BJX64DRAFT_254467 [Aspergillus heterothallicus]